MYFYSEVENIFLSLYTTLLLCFFMKTLLPAVVVHVGFWVYTATGIMVCPLLYHQEPCKLSLPQQWPFHRSASLSNIPVQPRINYLSLLVDEALEEVLVKQTSNTSLMIKGSWNQQITSWSKSHSHQRAVTFHNDISWSLMDYMWNNLSMATQQYLGKYCLAPQNPTISEGQHGPTMARKSKRTSTCDS